MHKNKQGRDIWRNSIYCGCIFTIYVYCSDQLSVKISSVYKTFRNGRFTEHASHLAVLPLKDNKENCNQTSKQGIYFSKD